LGIRWCLHLGRGASYENFGNRESLNSPYPMLIAIITTCHRIADAVEVICRMSRAFVLNAGTSRTPLLRIRKSAIKDERLHDG